MVTSISVLSQGALHGLLDPVQTVKVPGGYRAGVSPGVQHLPELLSVKKITLVHGNIGVMAGMKMVENGVTEIFV